MDYKDFILDFAKYELQKINFLGIDAGKTMLELISQIADLCHNDPEKMKHVMKMLPDILDQKLLSPITEEDFIEEQICIKGKEKIIYRCRRCPYVYKDADGKYYNDRAVAFVEDKSNNIYYTSDSKEEIELPYILAVEYKHARQDI